MSRPSHNADQRLIEAAQKMLIKTGLNRMNIRRVAAEAGVNLGMFHYHFKTKDLFIRAVLQDVYEKFFKNFSLKIEEADNPLEKLRQAILVVGIFVRDNRKLALGLIQDVLDGNTEVLSFVRKNGMRHVKILWDLVGQCQKEGLIEKMPRPQVFAFMMPAVAAPALAVGGVENVASSLFAKGVLKGVGVLVLSDQALQKRVDMALKGLGAREKGAKS
jgi:AcrR family transcriptional regulator